MQAVTIFGSNSGNKYETIEEAIGLLEKKAGKISRSSSYYETEPWGFSCPEEFLNRVVIYETVLTPQDFLEACLETESLLGRTRTTSGPRYSSRTIDIDLLFFGAQIISTPTLTLPHPRITERNFVLTPLNEIMPGFVHPDNGKTMAALLAECKDPLAVQICHL